MKLSEKILPKESRAFIEFQSKDEYLQAMVEDLSDWLNYLYNLKGENQLTLENFFRLLKNGVILCKHAQVIQFLAEVYLTSSSGKGRSLPMKIGNKSLTVPLQPPKCTIVDFSKAIFSFHERDNVSNFISWCKQFNIPESLTFETEDLVSFKNPRNVVVSLLEVSRIGRLFGMEVPDIIQLEQDIEDEIINLKELEEEESVHVEIEDDAVETPKKIKKSWKVMEHDSENDEDNIIDYDFMDSSTHVIKDIPVVEESETFSQKKNPLDSEEVSDNKFERNQENNNCCVYPTHLSLSLGKEKSFGFKGRRFSVNLSSQDFIPKVSKTDILNVLPNGEMINQCSSQRNPLDKTVIRKSQSVYFNDDDSTNVMPVDSSDTESNFSQSSRTDFKIPKHNTVKPIGRVKIYDNFNKSNYVKEKKAREKVDLRSLDERVREVLSQCQCAEMFPMKRISEGKYQYGDKNTRIFVRILRTHVMVRVGGGWDTLGDFFFKHDPCRKEKNNYKFCLPALSKKSQGPLVDNHLVLEANPVYSHNNFDFEQGMVEIKKSSARNKFDCNVQDTIMKNYETEDIIMEKFDLDETIVNEDNNEIEIIINKENSNESLQILRSFPQEKELSPTIETKSEINNNVCLTDSINNLTSPVRDNAVIMRRLPMIIDSNQKRRNSLAVFRNNNVKNSLIIPDKIEIKKGISRIPKPTFQRKK